MDDLEPVDSDLELLRAARTDSDAFGGFYRRHAVAVERWIRAQTPDMATAADLTAETFAQALVSLHRFRGATDSQRATTSFVVELPAGAVTSAARARHLRAVQAMERGERTGPSRSCAP